MYVEHHTSTPIKIRKPQYCCRRKIRSGEYHNTTITVEILDRIAWEQTLEVIRNPQWVRERVAELREQNKPAIDTEMVEATIENIRRQMHNLFTLAQNATDDETINTLGGMMKDLERQKRQAEALIYDIAEDDEERAEVEAEIVKFEKWVEKVQPLLTDPTYKPSYEEMRLAVRILGVKATVYPAKGEWPYRYQIYITIPGIVSKMKSCTANGERYVGACILLIAA